MKKNAVSVILFCVCTLALHAQQADLKNATWIRIMQNDTSVNYFVAKKDFAKFVSEYHRKELKEKQKEQDVVNTEEHRHEEHLKNPLWAAIMAFNQWSKNIRPFVSSDGKIMPIEQRMNLVNRGK